jgi:geranylgeranyl reductase family protein
MTSFAQLPVSRLTDQVWEVVVIGGGPAGAICALVLARAGHKVLVVDRAEFPRDKTCGDQLMPDSISLLEKLGLLERVRAVGFTQDRFRVFSPSRIDFVVSGRFIGIRRLEFDMFLIQAAVEAGVSFAQGTVVDIKPSINDNALVHAEEAAEPLRARVVVVATGASVNLADKLGLIDRRRPSAVAMRTYIESDYPLEESFLSYDRSLLPGYAWVCRVGENRYNVGCGMRFGTGLTPDSLRPKMAEFMREFPLVKELTRSGRRVAEFRGAPLRCGLAGSRGFVRDNVLCAGEVIGTTFPFTGEGIGTAMQTGLLAAETICLALAKRDLGQLLIYADRIDRELRPAFRGYRTAEKWLSKPWVNDFMARRFRRSRYLQGQMAALFAGSADPHALFSVPSVIKSLWK